MRQRGGKVETKCVVELRKDCTEMEIRMEGKTTENKYTPTDMAELNTNRNRIEETRRSPDK